VILYVDTSAAMKLLVEEAESAELAEYLESARRGPDTLVASLLLHAELHCAANRRPEHIQPDAVADVLSAIELVDVESGDLTAAPLLPGRLRSAGAVHLATALRVDARTMVAYDGEFCAAARSAGLRVVCPA
jgi:predicted nucleic acid-binding protein